MEPKPVIELNNSAAELAEQEEQEELKVLVALTQVVARYCREICDGLAAATHIDLACARARHARWATSSQCSQVVLKFMC